MERSPEIPPFIEKHASPKVYFLSLHCTSGRLFAEILIATVAGLVAFILPALFFAKHLPNYEQAVFLPIVSEVLENMDSAIGFTVMCCSASLMFAVSLAIGFFGRAPIWLTGPAIMLGFPIWAMIDAIAGGGGHDLIPFEIIFMYVLPSPFFIVPTLIGRAIRALIKQ
jgi:hypothetical protein